MTDHLTWDTLNELADGLLTLSARASAEGHLSQCPECRTQLARLRAMLQQAAATAAEVEPPDLWANVRGEILAKGLERATAAAPEGPIVAGRIAIAPEPRQHRRLTLGAWWLVAASLVLVAGSSAITAWVMRGRAVPPSGVTSGGATIRAASLPADIQASEREYLKTADALRGALEQERSRLAPETIAIVERSLTVIEGAIGEAREALLRDPSNLDLRDLWSRSHQQKLDLLRRAALLVQKA